MQEVTDAKAIFRDIVDEAFFEKLSESFTEVMGPIGPVIIEDEIQLLGEDRKAFPQDKVQNWLRESAWRSVDSDKRAQFQKEMVCM